MPKKSLRKSSNRVRTPKHRFKKIKTSDEDKYKEDLLSVSNREQDYDRIFERKLAENYKVFRDLKEHRIQIRKLGGIIVFVLIIILAALLMLTFS